jgi:DNA-binding Xre family transcriptional regulator
MSSRSGVCKSWKRGIKLRKASYKKLWKLLIDRDMNKKMLAEAANISLSSLSKLAKSETVNVEILIKICNALNCDMQDIMELVSEQPNTITEE